jgi:hypothetical protein
MQVFLRQNKQRAFELILGFRYRLPGFHKMRGFLNCMTICYLLKKILLHGLVIWLVSFLFDSLFRFAVLKYQFNRRKVVPLTISLDICAFCYLSRG